MITSASGAAIFGTAGPRLLAEEAAFFRDYDPFGFILFARNVENPDQLRRLTSDLRECVGRDAPILIDQEGGRVQRLRAPHWREWLPPLDQIALAGPKAAVRSMFLRSRIMADELHSLGIDANCAPCCDLAFPDTHPFLRNRCYGGDATEVAQIGRAVADGLLAGGVLPVMKHLPGHGRSTLDTHHALPTVSAPLETLGQTDFLPFRVLADLPMAMTGHLVFERVDPAAPATQSRSIVNLIRQEIGFSGLLMTDDLNMNALSGSLAERAERAIRAGCDVALHCKGDLAEMRQVAQAAGTLSPDSLRRARLALSLREAPQSVDIAALEAELSAILKGGPHVR